MAISTIPAAGLSSGVPTRAQLPAGSVLQIAHTQSGVRDGTTTVLPIDTSIPQNTEGKEYLTLSITPTSSTNTLLITVNTFLGLSPGNWGVIALFKDSAVDAIASTTTYMATNTGGTVVSLTYSMVAGSTSSTTFKLRYGPGTAGTCWISGSSGDLLGGTLRTTITIMEVAA